MAKIRNEPSANFKAFSGSANNYFLKKMTGVPIEEKKGSIK